MCVARWRNIAKKCIFVSRIIILGNQICREDHIRKQIWSAWGIKSASGYGPRGTISARDQIHWDTGSAEIWIFVQPWFLPKLTQLFILPGLVNEYQHLLGVNLGLISVPSRGESHLFNTTITGDKRRLHWPSVLARIGFSFSWAS